MLNPAIFKMLSPEEKTNVDLFELEIPDHIKGKRVGEVFNIAGVALLALYNGEKFSLPNPNDPIGGKSAIIISTVGKRKIW